MYGCTYNYQDAQSSRNNTLIRVFPYMFSQRTKMFSFKESSFAIEKEKESTGRIVVFREMEVANSYTLEASFYGAEWFRER